MSRIIWSKFEDWNQEYGIGYTSIEAKSFMIFFSDSIIIKFDIISKRVVVEISGAIYDAVLHDLFSGSMSSKRQYPGGSIL